MKANRSHGTRPELLLAEMFIPYDMEYVAKAGVEGLLCRPDLIHPSLKVAVFMHGCYWHGCPFHWKCPKTNRRFWMDKVDRNERRHRRDVRRLNAMGWAVMTVWEHDLKTDAGRARVLARLERVLDGRR